MFDISKVDNFFYIKLGEGGRKINTGSETITLEKYCINNGFAYFGYGSEGAFHETKFDIEKFIENHRGSSNPYTAGRAIGAANRFFSAGSKTVWFTFVDQKMHWCILEGDPFIDPVTGATFRKSSGGWKSTAIGKSRELHRDELPGGVTKISAYRGTICGAGNESETIRRLISGNISQSSEEANKSLVTLNKHILGAIQQLNPKDFEVLVDLVLVSNGWRRRSSLGSTTSFSDGRYENIVLGKILTVQTKSKTNFKEFEDYVSKAKNNTNFTVDGEIFAYCFNQSDDICKILENDWDVKFELLILNPDRIAYLAIESGLSGWVIDHAR